MSRIESTDMSNELAVATHTALMLGQKQAIYRGSKNGLRVYYLAGETYPDPSRKEEAVFFVVDEETGKYTVMTHADLRQERLERKNGVEHSAIGEAFISSYLSEDSDHLEHYGIKGMKWGIRRFQNKDGSLTKAGLKRYSDAASEVASKVGKSITEGGKKLGEAAGKAVQATKEKIVEKHAQRKEEKRVADLMSKPIRKLTEEERAERMERRMKEKELLNLEKNVRDLDSGAMSKGRKFAEDMVTKVAIPAVLNAGEKQLTAFLNKKLGDALGLGEKDTNIISDLLKGDKKLTDLTDKELNTVGKGAESWGNFTKNVLGKNPDQDGGPTTTYFRDIMSGKLKLTDLDDKTAKDVSKIVEGASNTEKFMDKHRQKDDPKPQSDSAPKSEPKTESAPKSESKTESTPKSEPKTESAPKTESKPARTEYGDYKMRSVEEMSSYTPVKSGKSALTKTYESGYKMRSVEDISSSTGMGESYTLRMLYSSGYRMAPLNDK